MRLDPREASLVEVFRRLPPDTIDWSDSWTDEDLQNFRAASLAQLEAEESEESN